MYYRGAAAAIVVYDITRQVSRMTFFIFMRIILAIIDNFEELGQRAKATGT